MLHQDFKVDSPNVVYGAGSIKASYSYDRTEATVARDGKVTITPIKEQFEIETKTDVPKTGVMIVGLGGNNGSTFVAGIVANREGISWRTRTGIQRPNYFG